MGLYAQYARRVWNTCTLLTLPQTHVRPSHSCSQIKTTCVGGGPQIYQRENFLIHPLNRLCAKIDEKEKLERKKRTFLSTSQPKKSIKRDTHKKRAFSCIYKSK